jgi:hypothetical protein
VTARRHGQPAREWIGTCPDCGKHRFQTRADAKRAAKQLFPGEKLRVYPCGGYYHFGNTPLKIKRGGRR